MRKAILDSLLLNMPGVAGRKMFGGKPKMREWVQINRTKPADHRKDLDILRAAFEYVSQQRATQKKTK